MWRAHFCTKSWLGRYVYQPIVATAWVVFLLIAGYKHVSGGEPRPWALPILLLGFLLFSVAKASLFRKGMWISFGASAVENMSKPMSVCYYLGYVLMIVGFILSFHQPSH